MVDESSFQLITHRQNAQFKQWAHWHLHPHACQKAGIVLLEGIHLLKSAYDHACPLEKLVVSESALKHVEFAGLLHLILSQQSVPVWVCPDAYVRDWSQMQPNTAVMGVMQRPPWQQAIHYQPSLDAVLLAGVQDPGNVGTILRSAGAMGIRQIICLAGTADIWSKKIVRAGMGAHFALRFWRLSSPESVLTLLPVTQSTQKILALDLSAEKWLFDVDLTSSTLWMLGSEGSGLPASLLEQAHHRVIIPQPGGEESLNVGVASGIAFYEMAKQRLAAK